MQTLEAEPPVPSGDPRASLDRAALVAEQLPRLGSRTPSVAATWRLRAALWSVAARHDIALRPEASLADVARLLVGHGAVIPPAGDALVSLDEAMAAGIEGADPVADALAGYLELRARFG